MASLTTMKLLMMMLIVMMLQWSLVDGQQQSGSNEDLSVPPQNIAELPSDANVTTTASVDQIGVRILYDEGKPTIKAEESCAAAELAMIQSTAWSMIYNQRDRHLRRRRLSTVNAPPPPEQRQLMPSYCYTVCRGFVTGKCQVIYRACDEWRRDLGASTYVHDTTNTPVVDQNYSDNGSLDQDDERKLSLSAAAKARCQYEMDQVRNTLQSSLYTQLSTSCKKLMKKRTTLKCVLFSE